MIYKTLKKVSDVCQVLDKSKYPATQTINGATFTNNGDGTITVNSLNITANAFFQLAPHNIAAKNGHKYCVLSGANRDGGYFYVEILNENGAWITEIVNKMYTVHNDNRFLRPKIYAEASEPFGDKTYKPQLFDLTEMYGAGNEPTTVEQFRQDFPEEMYDYKPYCFVKSYKTLLKASNVCQLLDKSKYPATQTINGVTFTNNGDGTVTANGTATAMIDYRGISNNAKINLVVGHKYLMRGCPAGGSKDTYDMRLPFLGFDYGNGVIAKLTDSGGAYYVQIIVRAGIVCDNLIFKPQLFDLTEMYGAGNEPATVEEFREKFPNELYDYKPYSIITSYKKSFKVTNSILL